MWEFIAGFACGALAIALFLPRDFGMSWTVDDAQAGRAMRLQSAEHEASRHRQNDLAMVRQARNLARQALPDQVFNGQRNYWIRYEDAQGDITQRVVTVHSLDRIDPLILTCHCHLRGQRQTFYAERMIECIDNDTGEVINDPERWFAQMTV